LQKLNEYNILNGFNPKKGVFFKENFMMAARIVAIFKNCA